MNTHLTKTEIWRRRWHAFKNPISGEKAEILKQRWDSLPPRLQTPNQISGRHLTHCGFILGASYCSFHCTHCYLPKNANRVPIPSLAEVKEQIDANRRFQGPGGGLQITGGDVADAYWRAGRAMSWWRSFRYAYQVGLGADADDARADLDRATASFWSGWSWKAACARSRCISIGRRRAGKDIRSVGVESEADLHPVREAFTQLAQEFVGKPGCPLEYALSFTVTAPISMMCRKSFAGIWTEPERTQIWRMLSFQPEADTGRTIFSEKP